MLASALGESLLYLFEAAVAQSPSLVSSSNWVKQALILFLMNALRERAFSFLSSITVSLTRE
jgi:hypothetical protein